MDFMPNRFSNLFFDNFDNLKNLSQQLFTPSVPQMLADSSLHQKAYAIHQKALKTNTEKTVKQIERKRQRANVEIEMWGSTYNVPYAVLQSMMINVSQQAVDAIDAADQGYAMNSFLLSANELQERFSRTNQQRMTDYSIQKAKRHNLIDNIFSGIKIASGLFGAFL